MIKQRSKHYKLSKLRQFKTYRGFLIEPAIRNFFTGRIWQRSHTPFPQSKIETYITRGYFEVVPAVLTKPKLSCRRCHNETRQKFVAFHCAKCKSTCYYCRHCITMGRMCSCDELLLWKSKETPLAQPTPNFTWAGQLTTQQEKAAKELTENLIRNRHHLVSAVCGAGKTEILFAAIHQSLLAGKRVCVATPRTDVVLELFPRFQQVFQNIILHAYYGNAPQQQGFAQLVLATTHQLYRFENAFDVMIVDEADAFPYTFDEALQRAVLKAKTSDAPIAFVTATPSQKLLTQQSKQNWGYSFIARRFHGFPLPVPKFQSLWRYEKAFQKGEIPPKLLRWLEQRLQNNEPFLLFFPTIELMELATPLFQHYDSSIESVHAEDPNRKEKVVQLRNEERKGLLTTSILERGITIKNVQVAVIGAENPVFTSSALIQISGRVGRNIAFPDGDITFFHHGLTLEMDVARKKILEMNQYE
ncbi:DNA/RNA helicase [Lysinibacillus sp. 2017]|uniref:DEAD/DEAH box helicase n=2 Tax=unclassified Lysinibacillus TaxID=2636778 RepID=UPI000D527C4C|nr:MULTISPECIES: DEAD/DEAH box helicase [unclassified Lysinibacillus]AWE06378.1 DNA/RNA helicase [Lysinibacillus sp. 2017]TGN29918.1 DEAD/DEAH box helicase [Lysinibacillus sp. S2017]